MTDQGPFRTEPSVIKLEQQLRDKSEECEDLRRERDEYARQRDVDNRDARDNWTVRFVVFVVATVLVSIAYFIWRHSMRPTEPEGACREVILAEGNLSNRECPYAGQTTTAVGDRVKCTCPTAPVGSVK